MFSCNIHTLGEESFMTEEDFVHSEVRAAAEEHFNIDHNTTKKNQMAVV
jgi:hypothetical protein